ncbi:MAG: hypothetical protein J4415_00895 [Candidatus Diapherotrites archaeon]|uniref:Alpha-galactosidase NEW3 domain-containing protein n=1 Tax=Candidatus Iainarchaeum sp. TaxID=3101447 RepID=A0A8T4KZQ8_9ARCH|nr:hypothetical protein [Candidatus Diapherotrites archaeon]
MLNKFVVLPILILMLGFASADILVTSPTENRLLPNERLELGSISPGETLIIGINSDTGYTTQQKWSRAEFISETLPENWEYTNSKYLADVFTLQLKVPEDAEKGAYNAKIKLTDVKHNIPDEFVQLLFYVEDNLITADISDLRQDVIVGEQASFKLTIINDSIAEHEISVASTLPSYWFSGQKITARPKSVITKTLKADPKVYGTKQFDFYITSEQTGKKIATFNAQLNVFPTPSSKFASGFNGLAFFTPNMLVSYFINSFISLLG